MPLTLKVIEKLCCGLFTFATYFSIFRYKSFKISLGGSGLNSSRILVNLGEVDLQFFGAIGKDKNGKLVRDLVESSGVETWYEFRHNFLHDDSFFIFSLEELKIRTGTVICLCQNSDRSLVANIGAALKLEKSFVKQQLDNFTTSPSFYYIEGFFIPDKMDIVNMLYDRFSHSPNTLLVTNLNAPYIVKHFQKEITFIVNKADVIFGNRDEFEELASINGFKNLNDLLEDLFSSYCTKSLRQKVIVITDGENDVVYYKGDANGIESGSVNVPQVNKEDIVDTTGAGDSFVAGFLYELIKGKEIRECIEFGIMISSQVIRTIGCNLPKKGSNETNN